MKILESFIELKAWIIFPQEILVVSEGEAAPLEKPKVMKLPVDLHKITQKYSDVSGMMQAILDDFGWTETNDSLIEAIHSLVLIMLFREKKTIILNIMETDRGWTQIITEI